VKDKKVVDLIADFDASQYMRMYRCEE